MFHTHEHVGLFILFFTAQITKKNRHSSTATLKQFHLRKYHLILHIQSLQYSILYDGLSTRSAAANHLTLFALIGHRTT